MNPRARHDIVVVAFLALPRLAFFLDRISNRATGSCAIVSINHSSSQPARLFV